MMPENDEGRPGEGRPRGVLLAGENNDNATALGVTVPWSSVPDNVIFEAQSDASTEAETSPALRLPTALEARLTALEGRVEAVEALVICPWACGTDSCPWRCM